MNWRGPRQARYHSLREQRRFPAFSQAVWASILFMYACGIVLGADLAWYRTCGSGLSNGDAGVAFPLESIVTRWFSHLSTQDLPTFAISFGQGVVGCWVGSGVGVVSGGVVLDVVELGGAICVVVGICWVSDGWLVGGSFGVQAIVVRIDMVVDAK